MSSDEFDRASDGNDENGNAAMMNANDAGESITPILATPANTRCYSVFDQLPVRVEGPEFNRDFTYYLVDKMPDLKIFEKGIKLD